MFTSYFLPRWNQLFTRLNAAVEDNAPFDRNPFATEMCAWEQQWSRDSTTFATQPRGDAVAAARRMSAKWR